MVQTVQSTHHLQFKRCHLQIDKLIHILYIDYVMSDTDKNWTIDSEWTLESSHFKYHYVVSNVFDVGTGKRAIKTQFVDYMNEMYGKPGKRWGFRFDRNFDRISLYFSNQEDAIIFRLTHG